MAFAEDDFLEAAYEDANGGDFDTAVEDEYEDYEDGLSDVEADAMALAGAGWGTDEDYGYFGGEDY